MNKMGFGFLRLPRVDEADETSIHYNMLNQMVDEFLAKGGDYFDTAYTYLGGCSEIALRESLVKRHPRACYRIADKLPTWKLTCKEDCEKYFKEQLERCGVDYFDVYLLHGLEAENYEIAEKYEAFSFLSQLKKEGKTRKIGFSFHDTAELLDKILTAHPELDCVLLQINYLDWESEAIQSRKCYEAACKHQKTVLIMEPVKGGTLANVPDEVQDLFNKYSLSECDLDKNGLNKTKISEYERDGSKSTPARWALRFAQSLPQVEVVLSGMSTLEQVKENMQQMQPVAPDEWAIYKQAAKIICKKTAVPCTGCRYCVEYCSQKIAIPEYFKLYNEYYRNKGDDWKIEPVYQSLNCTHGKASDCIKCHACEKNCPQQISISQWMDKVAEAFECEQH